MSAQIGSAARRTALGHVLQPDRQVPAGRRRSAGLQRAHHHSRPEERPAPHHARWRSSTVSGRRWVWSPWGEVHWVRNLRAAGRATITVRGRKEEVRATELDPTQRVAFFRDILGPVARGIPFGVWFIRIVDGVDLDRSGGSGRGSAVFELHPLG